jgi:hypothetical protein
MKNISRAERLDFAKRVQGDHPDEISFREFVLSELRLAIQRTELVKNEIKAIGVALKGGLIDAEMALAWLSDANGLHFIKTCEPPDLCSDDIAELRDSVVGQMGLPA